MKVVTLNIRHGDGTKAKQLLCVLTEFSADVVVLTEYRENSNSDIFKTSLFDLGYKWQASNSIDPKQNSVFLAARIPFVCNSQLGEPGVHQHRLLLAKFSGFNVIGVYFPQNEEKRPVFEFLIKNARGLLGEAGLLIGDFNTGKPYIDEVGKTFACADCFDDLETAGLVDAWRTRNPDLREYSWFSAAKNGFRIDHVFCTERLNLQVTRIATEHGPREVIATDHSAMVVEFLDSPAL